MPFSFQPTTKKIYAAFKKQPNLSKRQVLAGRMLCKHQIWPSDCLNAFLPVYTACEGSIFQMKDSAVLFLRIGWKYEI